MMAAIAFLYKSNIKAKHLGRIQLLIMFQVTNELTVLKKKTTTNFGV
ncbi:MAG: hypothetical protein ACJAT2_000214 [Bacteriovoracaceae bacterium]|jgi:hypothetical protein